MVMVAYSEKEPGCDNDAHLWHRMLEGDRCALSSLFKKYYTPLLNYGLNILSREDVVKDSIQELFFTIWESREELSEIKYVKSYIYSSFRRSLFRQTEIKDNRKERDETYTEESFRELLNKEELMIESELKKEQKQRLLQAIDSLSKRQKEAIFLKFQEGLSNEEIAQVMEVNKQSVYNYIHRAIVGLQDYLEFNDDCPKVVSSISSLSVNMLLLGLMILFFG